MPMQNLLLLAELKALGVCPCGVYYFWQNWGHWACAHAEFITFGRTEGIGRVPMQNCRGGRRGWGGGGDVGETRATRWALRPPRCGAVQPGPAGAAVSGASGGIGSGHSRHQTPDTAHLFQCALQHICTNHLKQKLQYKAADAQILPFYYFEYPKTTANDSCRLVIN